MYVTNTLDFGNVRFKCGRVWLLWWHPRIRIHEKLTEIVTSLPEWLIWFNCHCYIWAKKLKHTSTFLWMHSHNWWITNADHRVLTANMFGVIFARVWWLSRMSTMGDVFKPFKDSGILASTVHWEFYVRFTCNQGVLKTYPIWTMYHFQEWSNSAPIQKLLQR